MTLSIRRCWMTYRKVEGAMGHRLIAVLIAVGMLAGWATPSSALKKKKVKTSVEAEATSQDNITGDVNAKKDCDRKRTVKATHVDGDTGATTPAGKTITDKDGDFSMNPTVTPVLGDQWLLRVVRRAYNIFEQARIICLARKQFINA